MIEQRTTFVLGAGASSNYGFPVGGTLKQNIATVIQGQSLAETPAVECLLSIGFSNSQIADFARTLGKSAQPSVDAFLEHRSTYMDIGKAFIAHNLIVCENEQNLYGGPDNWYHYILNRMTASFDDFSENNISFVTFNYDRSLEHFFYTALLARYGRSPEQTAAKVRVIPIVHVHGELGLLDWQVADETQNLKVRSYDPVPNPETVKIASDSIKVVHETQTNTPEFLRAQDLLEAAERIYFLGFGYHVANVRRLNIHFHKKRHVRGSCLGLTNAEKTHLEVQYHGLKLGAESHKTLQFLRAEPTFQSD